jgi:hypothetical protein
MNSNSPLFPVPANANTKSVEGNLKALETLCHVVEYKAPYALVHASPLAVARIATELALEVFHAKRGGEYYAVRVGSNSAAPVMSTPRASLAVVPAVQAPAAAPSNGSSRMNIGGTTYIVRETPCKRRIDVRRWEVRKVGEDIATPYVVTFQADDGSKTACSCKGGIFHKHCKHMDAFRAAYGLRTAAAANVA